MPDVVAILPQSPLLGGADTRLRDLLGDRLAIAYSLAEADPLIPDAEIILSFALPQHLAAKASRLAWVQALGSGTEAIRLPEDRPVILTNAAGINAVPVAEAAMCMLLAHARALRTVIQNQIEHHWDPKPSSLLRDATVGIVGTGHIAQALARRAAAFDMRIVGFSSAPRELPSFGQILRREALLEAAGALDFLVLATPLGPLTRNLVDARILAALKPGALLVNLARGELVDEAALVEILQAGRISASLDVFAEEPLPMDSPLWDLRNVLITPHSAGHRPGYFEEAVDLFEDNLARYLRQEFDTMRNRIA